jgi:glycosyltransferase involved in cell wall biosynthesis
MASTFPRWTGDTEPRFVESLSYELARSFDVTVLAPHCRGSATREVLSNGEQNLEVRRYRYFFTAFESLAYDGGMLSRVRRNPLRLLLLPMFLLAQMLAAARLMRESQIAAIHAHWIIPQGLVAAALRAWSQSTSPILITSHGGDLYALRGRILERLKRWALGQADAVTVVSAAMREYCEERSWSPGRIAVQSMGVDLDFKFTPGDSDKVRDGLVFVGRLVEKKGVAYLIEAMSLLNEKYPALNLSIVGDGPLRKSLIDLAIRLGVRDKIVFVGSVPNEDVPDYFRAANIAVMPSVVAASGDQEGLGLVAVEAQGCGCAVVASNLPAVRDTIIDGQTGLMAEPANAVDLAEKIALLIDDDGVRKDLARSGRQYALKNFTWAAVGESYTRIIEDMVIDSGKRKDF